METLTVQEIQIRKIDVDSGEIDLETDFVAKETPLQVFLNRIHYATIMCSPNCLQELVIGHLLSEGLLKSVNSVTEVSVDSEKMVCKVKLDSSVNVKNLLCSSKPHARLITSACGSPQKTQTPKPISRTGLRKPPDKRFFDAKTVSNSVQQLNKLANLFRKTGGVHAAALFDAKGGLITLAEDVGRHNAVDKAIGAGALKGTCFDVCFLALSGRLSGDIVSKAARVRIPLVASLAAALSSGIEVANYANLTLVGFVRGKRMNIYTNSHRIRL